MSLIRLFLLSLMLVVPPSHAETAGSGQGSGAPVILVFGDSLSAEYGLARGTGWVTLLEKRLAEHGAGHRFAGHRIANASVSGETTSGGVTRLPALLAEHRPAIVILELGSNDGLRGLPLDMAERNLDTMTQAAQDAGATVLIAGMQIPPNYGRAYTERFQRMFETVAERHGAERVPFLLEGIADDSSYFLSDLIHPNESAQPVILENVWRELAPLL